MRTYLTVFFVTITVVCLVWVLLFYTALGSPVRRAEWIAGVYRVKDEAAFSIIEPKVVFVSGSGMLFGVDSKRMSDYWGMPVINYGVHAGLGLHYILERSKRVLQPGDIAILALEYDLFQGQHDYTETLLIYMVSNDVGYFHALPLFEKARVIAKMSWKRLRKGLKSAFRKGRKEGSAEREAGEDSGVYRIDNIDARGDQLGLEPENMSERDRSNIALLKATQLHGATISAYSREVLDGYLEWARARHICVIAIPASHVYFDEYHDPEYARFLGNIMRYFAGSGVPYIGDPYNYMYEKSFYFGERYHLNSLGIQKRTDQLVEDVGSNPGMLCETQR